MITSTQAYTRKNVLAAVQHIKSWGRDTDGAITVDWVVLTATMTVIGGIIVAMTIDGTTDVGVQIGAVLTDKEVN